MSGNHKAGVDISATLRFQYTSFPSLSQFKVPSPSTHTYCGSVHVCMRVYTLWYKGLAISSKLGIYNSSIQAFPQNLSPASYHVAQEYLKQIGSCLGTNSCCSPDSIPSNLPC